MFYNYMIYHYNIKGSTHLQRSVEIYNSKLLLVASKGTYCLILIIYCSTDPCFSPAYVEVILIIKYCTYLRPYLFKG